MWLLILIILIVMVLDLSALNLDDGLERLLYVDEEQEVEQVAESPIEDDGEEISLDENFASFDNSSNGDLASDDDVLRAINEMYNKGN